MTVLLAVALFVEAGLLQAERLQAAATGRTRSRSATSSTPLPLLGTLLRPLRARGLAAARPAPRARRRARPRLGAPAAERLRGRVDARRLADPVRRLLADREARRGRATPPRGRRRGRAACPSSRCSPRDGPRLGTPVVLGLALLATGAASAGAVALDVQNTATLRKAYLPRDPSWVDRFHLGDVTLAPGVQRRHAAISLQELFWNRSITRVVLLPGATPGSTASAPSRRGVGDDGSLVGRRRPLGGPLLVDTYGSTVRLPDARRSQAGADRVPVGCRSDPHGRACASTPLGRYSDGWLAKRGVIYVWPKASGRAASPAGCRCGSPPLPMIGAGDDDVPVLEHERADVRARAGRVSRGRCGSPVCAPGRARHLPLERPRPRRSPRRERAVDGAGVHAERAACACARTSRSTPPPYGQMSPLRSAISSLSVYVLDRVFVGSTLTGIVTSTVGYWPVDARRACPRVRADQVVDHERRGGSVAVVVGVVLAVELVPVRTPRRRESCTTAPRRRSSGRDPGIRPSPVDVGLGQHDRLSAGVVHVRIASRRARSGCPCACGRAPGARSPGRRTAGSGRPGRSGGDERAGQRRQDDEQHDHDHEELDQREPVLSARRRQARPPGSKPMRQSAGSSVRHIGTGAVRR